MESFATVGLSHFPLKRRKEGRELYREIMACAYPRYRGYGPLPGVLEYVAGTLVAHGLAVMCGDVIPLHTPITQGSEMVARYAAMPVYWGESFASVTREDGRKALTRTCLTL